MLFLFLKFQSKTNQTTILQALILKISQLLFKPQQCKTAIPSKYNWLEYACSYILIYHAEIQTPHANQEHPT